MHRIAALNKHVVKIFFFNSVKSIHRYQLTHKSTAKRRTQSTSTKHKAQSTRHKAQGTKHKNENMCAVQKSSSADALELFV
ncbi:hypothetical protein HMPREF3232_00705 [Fannyhessea vaginae]|nr:hypothetical protein HMPREF3232_00705 [Fannyhessea vaginae]